MAIVSRMDVTKVLGRECCVRARKLSYAAVLKAGRGLSTAELILDGPRPRASLRGRKVNFNAQSGAGPGHSRGFLIFSTLVTLHLFLCLISYRSLQTRLLRSFAALSQSFAEKCVTPVDLTQASVRAVLCDRR